MPACDVRRQLAPARTPAIAPPAAPQAGRAAHRCRRESTASTTAASARATASTSLSPRMPVTQHRAARAGPVAQVLRQHPRRGLVVGDIENPLHRTRHDLEAPGQTQRAQCAADRRPRSPSLQHAHGATAPRARPRHWRAGARRAAPVAAARRAPVRASRNVQRPPGFMHRQR